MLLRAADQRAEKVNMQMGHVLREIIDSERKQVENVQAMVEVQRALEAFLQVPTWSFTGAAL